MLEVVCLPPIDCRCGALREIQLNCAINDKAPARPSGQAGVIGRLGDDGFGGLHRRIYSSVPQEHVSCRAVLDAFNAILRREDRRELRSNRAREVPRDVMHLLLQWPTLYRHD